jgi:hypothetical protein
VGPDGLAAFSVGFRLEDFERALEDRLVRILVTKRDPRSLNRIAELELTVPLPDSDAGKEPAEAPELKDDDPFKPALSPLDPDAAKESTQATEQSLDETVELHSVGLSF